MGSMWVECDFGGPPPSLAQILERLKLHTGLDDIRGTDEDEFYEIEHPQFGFMHSLDVSTTCNGHFWLF
jgi:hypothetical protein